MNRPRRPSQLLATRLETLDSGAKVRVSQLGEGKAIVLLHGYPDNLQIWCELTPRLADRFRVISFDWPGMGQSDAWKGGATPIHMADRLQRLLDVWQVERAVVVGFDMGAQPALVFAATHPERVEKLIVMNSLVLWDEETSWEIRLLRKFGWNRFILRHLPRIVFRRAERTFLAKGEHLPGDLRSDMWESFKRSEVREFIVRMCAGYQATLPRLPESYNRITAPTLVLWGERDKHFPPAHAKRLHELIPGSRLEIIPAGQHWMAWQAAHEVAARICDFA